MISTALAMWIAPLWQDAPGSPRAPSPSTATGQRETSPDAAPCPRCGDAQAVVVENRSSIEIRSISIVNRASERARARSGVPVSRRQRTALNKTPIRAGALDTLNVPAYRCEGRAEVWVELADGRVLMVALDCARGIVLTDAEVAGAIDPVTGAVTPPASPAPPPPRP